MIVEKLTLKSFSGAAIYVSLVDVTMQEAGSKLISRQVIKDVSYYCDNYNDKLQSKKIGFVLFSDMTNFRGRIHTDQAVGDENGVGLF
jgi:hypothetical protein